MAAAAARNRYGTGSLTQIGRERWRLQAYAGKDPLTGRRRTLSRLFTGAKRAANDELAKLVAEAQQVKAQSARGRPRDLTFGQLLDRWLAHLEALGRAPKTLHEYRRMIEHDIRPALGGIALGKLTAYDLDAFYAAARKRGLSSTTVRHFHAVISAALNQAERWEWVTSNPARRGASPPSVDQHDIRVPSPAELRDLIAVAQERGQDTLATAVALAALTGCRRGELCALRWSDVDMVAATVKVQRAISVTPNDGGIDVAPRSVPGRRPTAVVHIGPTKTHQHRTLGLDDIGLAVLRDRWAYQRTLAGKVGVELVEDPYILSPEPDGNVPIMPGTLTDGFRKLSGARWRFHDLRHWLATVAIAGGADIVTVSKRLGHRRASTTVDIYAHAISSADKALAASIGGLLTQPDA